jgi:hypothetical protein
MSPQPAEDQAHPAFETALVPVSAPAGPIACPTAPWGQAGAAGAWMVSPPELSTGRIFALLA